MSVMANVFADCVASTIKNVPQRIGDENKSSTGAASATIQKNPLWRVEGMNNFFLSVFL